MCIHKIDTATPNTPSWLVVIVGLLLLCVTCWPRTANSMLYTVPNIPSCSTMSARQLEVLQLAHSIGTSADLGYTLAAIAWEESKAGLYLVNNDLTDFGIMQVSLKYAKVREPELSTGQLVQRLITDDSYNINQGLKVLRYFEDYWEGDWKLAVRSYNAGFKHTDAVKYQLRIAAYVRVFQQCDWL